MISRIDSVLLEENGVNEMKGRVEKNRNWPINIWGSRQIKAARKFEVSCCPL